MKTFIKSLIFFLLLGLALAPVQVRAQNYIYIQIVHNSADTSLDTIDVYFNRGDPNRYYYFEDSNFVSHAATGLIQWPVDSPLTVGINYKHSDGDPSNDSILSVNYNVDSFATFPPDLHYALILSGLRDGGYAANPNGLSTSLNIKIVPIDTVAPDTAYVSLRFFQGATDLGPINIVYRNGGGVFPNTFEYGNSTINNDSIHHNAYEFQVRSPDTSINYGTFSANLSNYGGNSILILGSGFANPGVNDSGAAFGLYGLLNNGAVITFPKETAGFQILNNCADTAADTLDIYINDTLSPFATLGFRNATPALLFNAYSKYDVAIAPKNSTSVSQAFWRDSFFFPRDTFFIATASGLLSQTGYATNPGGISTAFDVLIKSPAEFDAASPSDFDFFMINGITDAPPLNLVPSGGPYLLTDVPYADQTNYVSLPSEFYTLYLQDTLGNTLVNGFANFLAFQSQSAVLLASGFLHPDSNNNGPALGLFMVPTTGGQFIPLFPVTGINKVDEKDNLNIFPNPANNQLHVLFTLSQSETVSLQITDINGQVIQQVLNQEHLSETQNITVDVSKLTEGVYFSRLITSEGISNSKFVVLK
jgi:hypothetical protein